MADKLQQQLKASWKKSQQCVYAGYVFTAKRSRKPLFVWVQCVRIVAHSWDRLKLYALNAVWLKSAAQSKMTYDLNNKLLHSCECVCVCGCGLRYGKMTLCHANANPRAQNMTNVQRLCPATIILVVIIFYVFVFDIFASKVLLDCKPISSNIDRNGFFSFRWNIRPLGRFILHSFTIKWIIWIDCAVSQCIVCGSVRRMCIWTTSKKEFLNGNLNLIGLFQNREQTK